MMINIRLSFKLVRWVLTARAEAISFAPLSPIDPPIIVINIIIEIDLLIPIISRVATDELANAVAKADASSSPKSPLPIINNDKINNYYVVISIFLRLLRMIDYYTIEIANDFEAVVFVICNRSNNFSER